jgi:ribonuclease HI
MASGRIAYTKLRIDMWISGSADKEGNGGYCALLSSMLDDRQMTKTIGGYAKNATVTRMTLMALRQGLQAIKSPSFLHIYTDLPSVSAGLHKNMYKWERDGWITAKGHLLRHADLWQEIFGLLRYKSLAYKVHYRQKDLNPNPLNRLFVLQKTSDYIRKAREDLYDVKMPV